MPSFNLVDEPWIPCTMIEDGSAQEVGLREALIRAPAIREIGDPSPLVTIALHRLLLAILHRNFAPESPEDWAELWARGTWDLEKLQVYFTRWRDRFDLFHPTHPFYQTASISLADDAPIAKLTHELASSANAATLFDHTTDCVLAPARAGRYLAAYQSFAVGGLVSFEKGREQDRSADAAPLVKSAVGLVTGDCLFRTLMLNLHRYSRADAEPFEISGNDCPAWERDEETRAEDRWPRGYLDLLTWQSRRIWLRPEEDQDGRTVVRRAVIMKGYQFPDGFHRRGRETMLAFTKKQDAKPPRDPWPAVGFRDDRALWRDSLALFQSVAESRSRPKTLDWLHDLIDAQSLSRAQTVPMEFFGLTTDQARVLFWRHERLPLPLAYLDDRGLLEALGRALGLTEEVAGRLGQSAWKLAKLVLAPNSDAKGARQPQEDMVRITARRLAPGRLYWSRLEVPFKKLLVDLPEDRSFNDDGSISYGGKALPDWARVLRAAALRAFEEAVDGLEASPRTIKAVATAEHELRLGLHEILRDHLNQTEEVTRESTN